MNNFVIVCLFRLCFYSGFYIYFLFLFRFCDNIEECRGEVKDIEKDDKNRRCYCIYKI